MYGRSTITLEQYIGTLTKNAPAKQREIKIRAHKTIWWIFWLLSLSLSLSPATVPRYHAHYRVVFGSSPRTAATQTLGSGLYLGLCVMVH